MPLLSSTVEDVVKAAVAKLLGNIDKRLAPILAEAAANARRGAPARPARTTGRTRPRRGDISRWVANRRARRVPTFVIEATGGLDTKKKIVARFGEDAVFQKGKPLPEARSGANAKQAEPTAARVVTAKAPAVRKKAAG